MAREQYTDIYQLNTTTLTDPWASAITTAIVDTYSAVIITTTAISTAQTLSTPTATSVIKRFNIINNTSSTHYIKINDEIVNPWTSKYFVWDWSAWTIDKGNIIGKDFINPLWTNPNYYIPYIKYVSSFSSAWIVQDRVYFIPYKTKQQIVINSLNCIYTVWVAASNVRLWVYSSGGWTTWNAPLNLLADSGALATTNVWWWTVSYNLPTPLVIPVNTVIWFAFLCDSTWVSVYTWLVANVGTLLWVWTAATATTPITYYRLTVVWDLPNPTSWSFSTTSGSVPVIHIWMTV